jgi:predicted AlkP superfamily phosphohydrolase/phosphomutase
LQTSHDHPQKILLIGLDGADWRVLQPAIAAGRMPVLARLLQEGSHGRLRSTIRPESSVAWSSFATGVNPGQHGIFGFARHQPESYQFSLADARHVAVRRFWDYLGATGRKVGLLNIPFTYPPLPVHGFLVGGMLTPGPHVPFIYPPELQDPFLAHIRPFMADAGGGSKTKPAVAARVRDYTAQQLKSAQWLLTREPWDFFAVVFTGLDRLQHFLWDEPELQGHLQQLDQALGTLLAQIPPQTLVLLISDHGFSGVANKFSINNWLAQAGYLVRDRRRGSGISWARWMRLLQRIPFAVQLKRRFLPQSRGPAQMQMLQFGREIVWPQTAAYYAPDGGIRLNMHGREPDGVVPADRYQAVRRELGEKLLALTDPRTGNRPVAHVYLREELYTGPHAAEAPDLIVEPQRDHPNAGDNYLLDGSLSHAGELFAESNPYIGNHASEGILAAWLPGTVPVQRDLPASIMDIAPTILAAMQVPVPQHMDGRVLRELFHPLLKITPEYFADPHHHLQRDAAPDNDDRVLDRLRNLGYLD